jgi:hypothetical protein
MVWLVRGAERKRSYIPERRGVLGLEQVRQLRHPDACAHMELGEPADTITRVTVRKVTYHIIR